MNHPEILLLPLVGLIVAIQNAHHRGAGWLRAVLLSLLGGALGAGGLFALSNLLRGPDRDVWAVVLTLTGGMLGPQFAVLAVRRAAPPPPAVDPPTFRYHPDPLASGACKVDLETVCDCCHQARGILYTGPFHTEEEVDELCPWCIHDGSAAARFHGEFYSGPLEEGPSADAADELTHRTPCFSSWQEPLWPVHCGDFCAFQGELELQDFSAELREEFKEDLEEIEDELGDGLSFYLFRCLSCGKHRLHADAS